MRTLVIAAAAALLVSGCGSDEEGTRGAAASPYALPQADEPCRARPGRLRSHDRQPVLADGAGLEVGLPRSRRGRARQRVEVTVTNQTKTILGITATVVHDRVTEDGEIVEDTIDWYAQDEWGGLWYLGEDTTEFENGEPVSKAGSWEAGVDGAQAGIIIPPSPEVGMSYRQEFYAGEAEDLGRILSLDELVEVPFGSYDGVADDQGLDAARAGRRSSTSSTPKASGRSSSSGSRVASGRGADPLHPRVKCRRTRVPTGVGRISTTSASRRAIVRPRPPGSSGPAIV